MELGSGSSSSSSSSSDSLNGLKFGKKIYFEDAGAGGLAKPSGAGSAPTDPGRPPPAPSTAKKGRGGMVPGGQPPRCQVEGCKVDLSDAKAYYSRHKVCGMHSKSPKVIVAGLEQRFCQQCSRFHLLPEFDQGKRSCRRRLAGHNERRRKPPPGTLLSNHYGNLTSPYFDNNTRGGSFLMDFSLYPTLTGRDSWPATRSAERALGNQPNVAGKFSPHAWQSNPDNHSSTGLLLQGSAARTTTCLDSSIPSGECFAGVSDSSRALSLLSTQPWGSRNHRSSSLGVNGFINTSGTPVVHSSGEAIHHFSSSLWGFKGDESSSTSHEIPPDLGLGQISQPDSSHYAGDLDVAPQNGREYLGLDHTRAYDSSVQNMHWSL